jgi:hypothetical protein
MKTGDLIDLDGKRYQVGQFRRDVRTFMVYDVTGVGREVPDDIPHKVVAQPPSTWPFITSKEHPKHGAVASVQIPSRQRELTPLEDWAPSEPTRAGGSIFLNPALGLRLGDTVNVTLRSGKIVRVTIQRSFASVPQRIERAAAKPKEPKTAFDHLLEGDDDEDTP